MALSKAYSFLGLGRAKKHPLPSHGAQSTKSNRRLFVGWFSSRWTVLTLVAVLLWVIVARKLPLFSERPRQPLPLDPSEWYFRHKFDLLDVTGCDARGSAEFAKWDLDSLREMVRKTDGYFARDWSLHLGWNNMRYIIEGAVHQAVVLNRTLILPTYVYARSCELSPEVCSAYGLEVNRTTWGVTSHLPAGERSAWRLPISYMLDISLLRSQHPVLLMSEYLQLVGLSVDSEPLTGKFSQALVPDRMKFDSMDAWAYDGDMVRVDRLPPQRPLWFTLDPELGQRLSEVVYRGLFIEYDNARRIVSEGKPRWVSDEDLEEVLNAYGYEVVHSYGGNRVEHLKFVGYPTKYVAVLARMRGFWDDYGSSTADVFWLRGEVHVNRRPGDMWFTTSQARDRFTEFVLYTMRRPLNVLEVARRVDMKMREALGGRMWMAAHMRRGDFVTAGWTRVGSITEQFEKIKEHIEEGKKILRDLAKERRRSTYDVPGAHPYPGWISTPLPKPDDPFFLATDERSPEGLAYLRDQGAILISDLLTPADKQLLGWPWIMTDFLGVLEQAVLARSAYFVGRAESSVSGGALNLRAAWGMDPRTGWVGSE